MTAINFPDSPTNGQTFVSGDVTYTYDGVKWTAKGADPGHVLKAGDTMTGTLRAPLLNAGDSVAPWDNNQHQVLIGGRDASAGGCGFVHIGSSKAGTSGDALIISKNTGTSSDAALVAKTTGELQVYDRLSLPNPIRAGGNFTSNAGNLAELNLNISDLKRCTAVGTGGIGIQVPGIYLVFVSVLARPQGQRTDLVPRVFRAATSTSSDLGRYACNLPPGYEAQIGGSRAVALLAGDYVIFRCETAGTGDLYGGIGEFSVAYLHG